ncbi:MAG: uridine diphosphate-N-acetylglucosamine-binding protein YvcK [Candidatus Magasanikbacteria bacterium]|nr:uridine diphosphate-N-acetylglucosamine-binding protein YvcK [Candidatus Magasanikbacteria bacterium]
MKKKTKVVVIGGGNGSAVTLVSLKHYLENFDISAVISMSDSGGSSGRLRKELGTLPPGDIMRAVLALSKYDYPVLRQIFYQPRFSCQGKLKGHNLGNLFLTLIAKYCDSFTKALDALSQSVETVGRVYPVTVRPVDLVAQLVNGQIVRTEAFIDEPRYNHGSKIKKIWLEPKCRINPEAAKAIKSADYIILSPGSLYTSIIATLLPGGMFEVLKKTKAELVYVVGNAYRLDGETGPERLSDFVWQLEQYLPRQIFCLIHNSHKPKGVEKKFYRERKWGIFDFDREYLKNHKIISTDLERSGGGLCDIKLGKILKKILI